MVRSETRSDARSPGPTRTGPRPAISKVSLSLALARRVAGGRRGLDQRATSRPRRGRAPAGAGLDAAVRRDDDGRDLTPAGVRERVPRPRGRSGDLLQV